MGGTCDILARGGTENGVTWLEFIRLLTTSDRYDSRIITYGLNKILWAYGSTPKLSYHLSDCRGFAWVDLFKTGACPNQCSGFGICNVSVCYCYDGWTSDDCSVQIPTLDSNAFPSSYAYSMVINPNYRISWQPLTLLTTTSPIPTHLALSVHTTSSGWIGIGFEPDDTGMINLDSVMAYIVDSTVLVNDYWSTRTEKPTLDTTLGGKSSVVARGGIDESGTWMEFIRPIAAEDPYDKPLNMTRLVKLTWAYGTTPRLSHHDVKDRGFVWVDFFMTDACPNNCNAKGVCNESVCTCMDGWLGEDCSIKKQVTYQLPSSFDHSVELDVSITLSWSVINNTNVVIHIERPGRGWIGVGFGGTDGAMTNSDMYIASIVSDMVIVQDYWSEGTIKPKLDTAIGGDDDTIYYSGQVSNLNMVMSFVRPLQGQDPDTDVNIGGGIIDVCWALGVSDSLSQHSSSNSHKLKINFMTGEVQKTIGLTLVLRYVHGSLMFSSWGVILLAGMMWVRYFRQSEARVHGVPQWFYVHRISQYFAFFLSLVGLSVGFAMTKTHFQTMFHSQLGMVVMVMSIFQVVYAYMRPQASPGGQKTQSRQMWEVVHRWNGRTVLLISIPVVFSGLWEFGAPVLFLALYGGYLLVVLILAIAGDIFKYKLQKHKKKDAQLEVEMFNEQNKSAAPVITFAQSPPQTNPTPPSGSRGKNVNVPSGTKSYTPVPSTGVAVPQSIRTGGGSQKKDRHTPQAQSPKGSPQKSPKRSPNNTNSKRASSHQVGMGMPKMSSFDIDPYASEAQDNEAYTEDRTDLESMDERVYQPGQHFV
eukprot:TRINITY_DN3723_c0_g1_i1.p1 TRINITY_DN3723_c0_g1~~TRINITY_DN3723_c0_g1_i1.p1  ORF type:complete len:894 (-),score=173.23 TRINITY_DN3723_c0_g1_i1:154-2589(-)